MCVSYTEIAFRGDLGGKTRTVALLVANSGVLGLSSGIGRCAIVVGKNSFYPTKRVSNVVVASHSRAMLRSTARCQ